MMKNETAVFANADNVKTFLLGQNRRVEAWFTEHWERLDGITGPIHKSTISKALSSAGVVAPVAAALDVLYDEMSDDPWAWCEPPESVDHLSDYAPLSWWFETLKPDTPWSKFERFKSNPPEGDTRAHVQGLLDAWRARLRTACDMYHEDRRLVQALWADSKPEYQKWGKVGDSWVLEPKPWQNVKPGSLVRHRVGNKGLAGRSPEEIGLAYAMMDQALNLPLIREARLPYTRVARVHPVHDHESEPVEAWAGDEFEGVEPDVVHCYSFDWDGSKKDQESYWVLHRVRFYWTGDRYAVEDVERFAQHQTKWGVGSWKDDAWEVTSPEKRAYLEVPLHREAVEGTDAWDREKQAILEGRIAARRAWRRR